MIIPNKSCFYTDGVGGRCKCQCHYLKPQEQSWKEEFEALIQGGYNQALSDYQEQLKKLL